MVKKISTDNASAIIKRMDGLKKTSVQVGWFSHQRYIDGTPVAYVAAIHEYGSPKANIPPRPFMRPTFDRHSKTWGQDIMRGIQAVLSGALPAKSMWTQIGGKVAGNIADGIKAVMSPPIKRERKTGTKPLVDTGQMIQSVTWNVNDKR